MTASWTGPNTLGSHDLQSWWERVPLVPNGGCAYDLRIIAITQRFLGPDLQTTILRLSYDNAEVNTIDWAENRAVLRVDNFARVSRGTKACGMSTVSKFCTEKQYETKMSVELNIHPVRNILRRAQDFS